MKLLQRVNTCYSRSLNSTSGLRRDTAADMLVVIPVKKSRR